MEIKALILTNKGLEGAAKEELEDIFEVKADVKQGLVFVKCTKEQLAEITYYGRTFNRAIELLAEFEAEDVEDIKKNIPEIENKGTVSIECEREGSQDFTSFEVQQEIATVFRERKIKVQFKGAKYPYFILVRGRKCYFGLDYAGIDLGKRDYRVFLGRESLRGNIAAALLNFAEYDCEDVLVDPFCRHGVIPIEAALIANDISVNKFCRDKLAFSNFLEIEIKDLDEDNKPDITAIDSQFNNIAAAKKNAKIAGVNKFIKFSRQDLEWLDLKFAPGTVDKIVTMPVQPSQANERRIDKIYAEFFEKVNELLSEEGKVVLCMKQGVDIVKKLASGFKIEEHVVMQGKEELKVLVLDKK
ncbi:methyltransferase [Candidatus Woesearchaeota archaeon]|nr:methyltransferase [Candidatus Woesearchaeota archaeon]